DVRHHIRTSSHGKDSRELLHRQHVLATDVDPTKQRNMAWFSLRHSILHRKPVLLSRSHTPRKRNTGTGLNNHACTTNGHHHSLSRTQLHLAFAANHDSTSRQTHKTSCSIESNSHFTSRS